MDNARSRASLKQRLLFSTIIVLAVLLFSGGMALNYLFEKHVARRVEQELRDHLNRLIYFTRFTTDGRVIVDRANMAARFHRPYSGLYWQLHSRNGKVVRSVSLWDVQLNFPQRDASEKRDVKFTDIMGPGNQALIVAMRRVIRQFGKTAYSYRFAVALNRTEVSNAVKEFSKELAIVLIGLALMLVLLAWMQIGYGLRPLRQLVPAINAILSGEKRRFSADHPMEVELLVEQLNSLLMQQELVMERSRMRAASLAHGLKTPLAGIAIETRNLHQSDAAIGEKIEALVTLMNRQVERELIRSRVGGSTHGVKSTTLVAPLLRDIIRTLAPLPRSKDISWNLTIADELGVSVDTDDLAEILGNILDNARKWADRHVQICARQVDGWVELTVLDDGDGLLPEQLQSIQNRGSRFDDESEGSGLGLAIVNDIVSAYGGQFSAFQAKLGGLGLRLKLPAA